MTEQCKICGDDWKRLNTGPIRKLDWSNVRSFNHTAFTMKASEQDEICGLCESMFVKYH